MQNIRLGDFGFIVKILKPIEVEIKLLNKDSKKNDHAEVIFSGVGFDCLSLKTISANTNIDLRILRNMTVINCIFIDSKVSIYVCDFSC